MPIARTWSEELVVEWMTLKGYLVEVGVPILGLGMPGRNEVDAIGAHHDGTNLEIMHVEVGVLSSGDNAGIINSKFDPKITNYVTSHINQILSVPGIPAKYTKIYIGIYLPKNFDRAKTPGIEVYEFDDFMQSKVKPTMIDWKSKNTPGSGYPPELPESLWLLKLLDFLTW